MFRKLFSHLKKPNGAYENVMAAIDVVDSYKKTFFLNDSGNRVLLDLLSQFDPLEVLPATSEHQSLSFKQGQISVVKHILGMLDTNTQELYKKAQAIITIEKEGDEY